MIIRTLDRKNDHEKALVAERMKLTLIDVMGEQKGADFYSMDWLIERLQEHIEMGDQAEIFLGVDESSNEIISQTIVRIESDSEISDIPFGYFSTIYVSPEKRKQGIARKMIEHTNKWCVEKGLPFVTYSTAKGHVGLIKILESFDYEKFLESDEMIRLKKVL